MGELHRAQPPRRSRPHLPGEPERAAVRDVAGGVLRASALLAVALVAAGATPAAGQDGVHRGLNFVAGLAWETGGPGESLVESLIAADLGDDRPGRCTTFCEAATPHPVDYAAGLAIAGSVGAGYRFPGPLSLDAVVSNGARGHTDGYNHPDRRTLVISYSTFLLTTTLGVHLPVIGLHAGPVVARTRWEVTENSVELSDTGTFTVGGTLALSAGMDVGGVDVSLRSGLRVFPRRDMELDNGVGLRMRYRAVYVGVVVRGGG